MQTNLEQAPLFVEHLELQGSPVKWKEGMIFVFKETIVHWYFQEQSLKFSSGSIYFLSKNCEAKNSLVSWAPLY